jgi:hypothetical protein
LPVVFAARNISTEDTPNIAAAAMAATTAMAVDTTHHPAPRAAGGFTRRHPRLLRWGPLVFPAPLGPTNPVSRPGCT